MVILDMAAGIEPLSRGPARAVDKLIIVVEPGRASIETAKRIRSLAHDLGISSISIVGNKVLDSAGQDFISSSLLGMDMLGFIPYDAEIALSDRQNTPRLEASPQIKQSIKEITAKLLHKEPYQVA
jgi:CO dehydrogenase maturation factor